MSDRDPENELENLRLRVGEQRITLARNNIEIHELKKGFARGERTNIHLRMKITSLEAELESRAPVEPPVLSHAETALNEIRGVMASTQYSNILKDKATAAIRAILESLSQEEG